MSSNGIHLTHYKDCTRCTWVLIITNAPESWIKTKDLEYGIDRRYDLNKEIVQKEIDGFNFVFEERGFCTHGKKMKKRTRPTRTPISISIENLSIAKLESESGKALVESATSNEMD